MRGPDRIVLRDATGAWRRWFRSLARHWPLAATVALLPVNLVLVIALLLWLLHFRDLSAKWTVGISVLLVVGGSVGLWILLHLVARRRFRFSMRGLLLGFATLCVVLASIGRSMHWASARHDLMMTLLENGADVRQWHYHNSNGMRTHVGFDLFDEIRAAEIQSGGGVRALLEHADALPDLARISFGAGVTDAGLQSAGDLQRFEKLNWAAFVDAAAISDQGLAQLRDWEQLRTLILMRCGGISDKGLADLEHLPNLERLLMLEVPVGDAGMEHLAKIGSLRWLSLTRLQISDKGLAHLHRLSGLETLSIRGANLLPQSAKDALYAALPDCCIRFDDELMPSNKLVRQIIIRDPREGGQQLATIDEQSTIAAVKRFFDPSWSTGWQGLTDAPEPATWELDFRGRSRSLMRMRVGDGWLQVWVDLHEQWNRSEFTQQDRGRLASIMGLQEREP